MFPKVLLHRLDDLALLGGASRYRYGIGGSDRLAGVGTPDWKPPVERLVIGSARFFIGRPPPLHVGWGKWARARTFAHDTICVRGTALNTALADQDIIVPLSEVFWNQFREAGQPWW